jgi:hypothetical protein
MFTVGATHLSWMRHVVPFVVMMGTLCASSPTVRGGESIDLKVEIGWNGTTRLASWAPVRVTIGEGPVATHVRIESPDPDDQVPVHVVPITRRADGTGSVDTAFRPGRAETSVTVRLLDKDGHELDFRTLRLAADSEASHPAPLRHDVSLWGTLGEVPGFVATTPGGAGHRLLKVDRAANLPLDPRGYGTLDVLVIATGKSASDASANDPANDSRPEWERIGPEQASAIAAWVRSGGHLVVSVGVNAERFARSPLGQALPMKFQGGSSTRQVGRLETLCSANSPIPLTGAIPRASWEQTDEPGATLAEDGAGPLLVRAPFGFGLLTVLAVDLDVGPLSIWKNVADFAPLLVQSQVLRVQLAADADNALRHQGLSDIASQWSARLDRHPAVARPSYWTVLGLLVGLMAVVGPLDYWLVNRWLRRPTLTWVTLPVWLSLGILVGVSWAGTANGSLAGGQLFEILDIDEAGNHLRGTAWLNVFSPRTARETITLAPTGVADVATKPAATTLPHTRWIGWMSEPEGSPGGLYRGSLLSAAKGEYLVDDDRLRVENVPILQWSTKQLLARWESDAGGAWVDNKLVSPGPGRLLGSLTLRRQLPLSDVFLVHGGRIYFPRGDGGLRPFLPWEPNGGDSRQRDLRTYLTGTTGQRVQVSAFQSEVRFKAEPYDPLNFDAAWLMRMSTFLQATGGRVYAGLDNRFLRELEMTELMLAGRAILIGRLDKPLCHVQLGNTELDVTVPAPDVDSPNGLEAPQTQATFVRIVLPVKRSREEERLRKKELKDELERIEREGR